MKLRTLDGELLRGKLTTEYPLSTDGSPVLIINGEPYGPEEADFYLDSATAIERKQLARGGYHLAPWSEHEDDQDFRDIDFKEEEDLGEETGEDDPDHWE